MSIPYPQRKLRLKKIAFFMDKPPFRYLNAHNFDGAEKQRVTEQS